MNWFKQARAEDFDREFLSTVKDPWERVQSSFIDAIAYFPIPRVIEVRLKDGHRYAFVNVSEEMYNLFKVSPSKGRFFNQLKRWYNQI